MYHSIMLSLHLLMRLANQLLKLDWKFKGTERDLALDRAIYIPLVDHFRKVKYLQIAEEINLKPASDVILLSSRLPNSWRYACPTTQTN